MTAITFNKAVVKVEALRHPLVFAMSDRGNQVIFMKDNQLVMFTKTNEYNSPDLQIIDNLHPDENPSRSNNWYIHDNTKMFEEVFSKLRAGYTICFVDLKNKLHRFTLSSTNKIPFNWTIQKRWFIEDDHS